MFNRVLIAIPLLVLLIDGCNSTQHDNHPAGPSSRVLSAAQAGNQTAQAQLGWMYHSGQGAPQDDAQAAHWWRKAADQGNAYAQLSLGAAYDTGRGVPQDEEQAILWYRKSADQGNAHAQFNLGVKYHVGEGAPRDYAQSVLWYRKAADQGDSGAQDNLGFAYAVGQGAPQSDAQAVLWYKKAADQGNANAQYDLSAIYDEGPDVPRNYSKSYFGRRLEWTAIKRSHSTRRDYSEAYFWVDVAVAGALDPETKGSAESMRDSIEMRLTNGELSAAQARATLWFEQHNSKASH